VPELGKVKSRLAGELSEPAALEIYRWLLRVQARVMATPKNSVHSYSDYVYFAPRISRLRACLKFMPDLRGLNLHFRAQSEGDLGMRLHRACSEILKHHNLALVWGADIPCLPDGIFDQAIALFPQSVIAPARDGGYAFLSLAAEKYSAAVFERIRWSTHHTSADQIRALKNAGIGVVVRGRVTDLDYAKDFTRILRELEDSGRQADLIDLNATIRNLTALNPPIKGDSGR
jgi:glycosyltransferase A (GT-A) superfamily protein (DUF2064 family)